MGWESAAIMGFSAISANSHMRSARSTAKAEVRQGEAEAVNIANDTLRTAGKLQTSFLQSGIVLEGAGVREILSQAFQSGRDAVGDKIRNTNARSKNTMGEARTRALDTIAQGFQKSGAMDSLSTMADEAWSGSWAQDQWNSLGQSVGSAFDPSPVGPYRSFGV